MRGHGDLARGRRCADYFACVLKGLNDLNAEVNDHRCFATRRVVVKEAIMTVGPQAFMAAEKLPDKIKRRLPCSPNVPNAYVTPHRGQRLRAYSPGHNLILHRRFRFKFNLNNWSCRTVLDAAARINARFAAPS